MCTVVLRRVMPKRLSLQTVLDVGHEFLQPTDLKKGVRPRLLDCYIKQYSSDVSLNEKLQDSIIRGSFGMFRPTKYRTQHL